MPVLVYYCRGCGGSLRVFSELGMDSSGLLPQALAKALDLATRRDFAEAAEVASNWGLPLSASGHQIAAELWRRGLAAGTASL